MLYPALHRDRLQTFQAITKRNQDIEFILENYEVDDNLQHLLAEGLKAICSSFTYNLLCFICFFD